MHPKSTLRLGLLDFRPFLKQPEKLGDITIQLLEKFMRQNWLRFYCVSYKKNRSVLLALAGRFASPVIPCVREAKSHKTERVSLKKESALSFW